MFRIHYSYILSLFCLTLFFSACQPDGIVEIDPPEEPEFSVIGQANQMPLNMNTGEGSPFHVLTNAVLLDDTISVYKGMLTEICGDVICGTRLEIAIQESNSSELNEPNENDFPKLFEPRALNYLNSGFIINYKYHLPIPFFIQNPFSRLSFQDGVILTDLGWVPISQENYVFDIAPNQTYGYQSSYLLDGYYLCNVSMTNTVSSENSGVEAMHGIYLDRKDVPGSSDLMLCANGINLNQFYPYQYLWVSGTDTICFDKRLLLSDYDLKQLHDLKVYQLDSAANVLSSLSFESDRMDLFINELFLQSHLPLSGFYFGDLEFSQRGVVVTYVDEGGSRFTSNLADNSNSKFDIISSEYYQNPITGEKMVVCDIEMNCVLLDDDFAKTMHMENCRLSFAFGIEVN